MQPGQFGVGELPDLRVHRGDNRRGGRLVLPVHVRGGLGGDDGADLGDLARYVEAGQVPAQCGQVDERDAGQAPGGRFDVGRHAQVEDE